MEVIKAQHILVETLPEAQNIKSKLDNGEFFDTLAKEFSKSASGQYGGDLGSIQKGKMVKPFEEKAFSLNVGEISEPVKTNFGYHLIKRYG